MMTYLKRYIALLLLCGMLTQCELLGIKPANKPETLPPITQEGKNTFGCYINGNLFLPRKSTFFTPKLAQRYDGKILSISVKSYKDSINANSIYEDLGFFVQGVTREGTYELVPYPYKCDICNDTTFLSPITYLRSFDNTSLCYFNNRNHDISGTITISKINNVAGSFFISGTFEFTLTMRKAGSCDVNVLRVTQGRFDLK
jgi:hypothetical protein